MPGFKEPCHCWNLFTSYKPIQWWHGFRRGGKTKVPTVVGTRYNIISFSTYLFFAFLAAFFFGAAFFLAAFFFVAMFLNLKWLVKKTYRQ